MDLQIIELGDKGGSGGDLLRSGNDLSVIYGWENMPYLALFGGNVEADTPSVRNAGDQDFSWWGNALLLPNNPSQQLNSQTERILRQLSLTSSNRLKIENAIRADLDFMSPFAVITVTTKILNSDILLINIGVREPDSLAEKQYQYIWNALKGDFLNVPVNYVPRETNTQNGLQYLLQIKL